MRRKKFLGFLDPLIIGRETLLELLQMLFCPSVIPLG